MAFIVKKIISGKDYYYLNKTKRVQGKVVSKHIAYLGRDKSEAVKKAKEILGTMEIEDKEAYKLLKKEMSVEALGAFCKRKGFVYPSAELYGGLAGFWDFGFLGRELKENIKKAWWQFHVRERDDVSGIDGAIITHPRVWEASGHVESFTDYMVKNKKTKEIFKVDFHELKKYEDDESFEVVGKFRPMFETSVGPYKKEDAISYLRPETAQLIFTNFKLVHENYRMKFPFGIAQIGKAFRNEISPRDFLFRCREFEQMELQFFINEKKIDECYEYSKIKNNKINILTAKGKEEFLTIDEMLTRGIFKNKWHAYWLNFSYEWFIFFGLRKENLRLREHEKEELAHYANAAIDVEYNFPTGYKEIFGSHDRGKFDLTEHEKNSKKDMKIFDEETKEKVLPRIIESSFGVERELMAFMFDAMYENNKGETILKLNPRLSSVKAAVFPIIKKPAYEKIAGEIVQDLRKEWNVSYDKSGSIGRRYARNDEIGTPYCITIDELSPEHKDVTIRDRDTTAQVRVKIKDLRTVLRNLINGEVTLEKCGKVVK